MLILLIGLFELISFKLKNRSIFAALYEPEKMDWYKYIVLWLTWHSIFTLLAIILKKRKILYGIVIFLGIKVFLPLLFMAIISMLFKSLQFSSAPYEAALKPFLWIIPLALYATSYYLFFRRQL